jgi:predicted amidophosphoribosyltransferase
MPQGQDPGWMGRRRMGGGGMGNSGFCICPKCVERIDHRQGIPCRDEVCPKCGAKMIREGAYHHRLWGQRKAQ